MAKSCVLCGKKEKVFDHEYYWVKDNDYVCDSCHSKLQDLEEKQNNNEKSTEKIIETVTPNYPYMKTTRINNISADEEQTRIISLLQEIRNQNICINKALSSINGMVTFFYVMYIIGLFVGFVYGFYMVVIK